MSNCVITHNDVLGVLKRSVCIFCLWQNLNNCVIIYIRVIMPVFYRFFDSFTFTGGERMNSLLRVGIDVGSTTIKVAVLNKERELVYQK